LEGLEKVSVNNLLSINTTPMHHKKDWSTVNLSLSAVLKPSSKIEISYGDNSRPWNDLMSFFQQTRGNGPTVNDLVVINSISETQSQVTTNIIDNEAGKFLAITSTSSSTTVGLKLTEITCINTITTSNISYTPIVSIDKTGNSISLSANQSVSGNPTSNVTQTKLSNTPSQNLGVLSPALQNATLNAMNSNSAAQVHQKQALENALNSFQLR